MGMPLLKRFGLYVFLLCIVTGAYAQEEEHSNELEQLGEQEAALPEEDERSQTLETYARRKLNLNTADAAALESLGILNTLEISQFLTYRKLLGPLISIYELQAVPGFDLPLIRRLLPFVDAGSGLEPYYTWRDYLTRGRQVMLMRFTHPMQKARGYIAEDSSGPHYNGSAQKLMLRYRYQFSRYASWGVVMEKDAGEQLFKGAQRRGFDHYGFHIFLQRIKRIKALALGDFTVNMGQGLLQWHGLAFGKSASVMQVKREGEVLRPYASAGEFFFFRGIGISWQQRNIEVTAFASRRGLDARAAEDTIVEDVSGSLVSAGYHRTEVEALLRGNITQYSAGSVVKWKRDNGHIAWNVMAHRFSKTLQKGDGMYKVYAFEGNQYLNTGIDHAFNWRNMHFFGEVAVDRQGKTALLQGLLATLAHGADLSVVYRREDRAYQALYGNAFGESNTVNNESGLYTGLLLKWGARWQLSAYVDVFRFPWVKYRITKPSGSGYDALLSLDWHPDKTTALNIQYRYENKPQDISLEEIPQRIVQQLQRHQWRAQVSMPLSAVVGWKCRVTAARFEGAFSPPGEAWLVYQQCLVKWRYWRFSAGYTWFDTAESEGVFLSGQGFPGDNSLLRLSGQGYFTQLSVQCKLGKKLSLWGRWRESRYPGAEEIGTAWDAVSGDKRSDVQIQLQWEL